jgi:hypothetical protein
MCENCEEEKACRLSGLATFATTSFVEIVGKSFAAIGAEPLSD